MLPDLTIEFTGSGPERRRLHDFAENGAHGMQCITFRKASVDGPARIAGAAMVWVPSRGPAGEQVALEAQAAGTPVLASRLSSLAKIVADGETGLLTPPADPVALARAARKLLEHPDELRRLSRTGPERMARDHDPTTIAQSWLEVYA